MHRNGTGLTMRRLFKYLFVLALIASGLTVAAVYRLTSWAQPHIYRVAPEAQLPHPAQVALIPGASVLPNKKPSNTLLNRLRAGIDLYNKDIVPKLLLSGDNTQKFYDEVHVMRDYCLSHGVKPEDIFLDHEGVRTYDTMARARSTFAVKTAVIVSQELYLPRALFLANAQGLKVEGYVADSSSYDNTWQARGREYLARVKSIWDTYIKKPIVPVGREMPVSGDGRLSWKKAK
jgi:SanA protein